jgi:hypothetical protein
MTELQYVDVHVGHCFKQTLICFPPDFELVDYLWIILIIGHASSNGLYLDSVVRELEAKFFEHVGESLKESSKIGTQLVCH